MVKDDQRPVMRRRTRWLAFAAVVAVGVAVALLWPGDRDRLRISMPLPGADFPTEFVAVRGVVFDLRRE